MKTKHRPVSVVYESPTKRVYELRLRRYGVCAIAVATLCQLGAVNAKS